MQFHESKTAVVLNMSTAVIQPHG